MEAKYISVEVLLIQYCFKVHHGFPICNRSLKPTLHADQKTKGKNNKNVGNMKHELTNPPRLL